MSELNIKTLAEIAPYEGEHAIPGIRFRPARAALGVSAWGMNVIEIDPHNEGYPEHDHVQDGQEEVYFVVEGAATLVVGEETVALRTGTFVRVPPELRRKFVTGDEPVVLLIVGATPGQAYEPPSYMGA